MGCGGALYDSMAKAFIKKGALAYFGWNERVDISHADKTTLTILHHLLIKKETIYKAIKNTMKEVGPDPIHRSTLLCYGLPNAKNIRIVE